MSAKTRIKRPTTATPRKPPPGRYIVVMPPGRGSRKRRAKR